MPPFAQEIATSCNEHNNEHRENDTLIPLSGEVDGSHLLKCTDCDATHKRTTVIIESSQHCANKGHKERP